MKFKEMMSIFLVAILAITAFTACASIGNENVALDDETLIYVGLRINPEIELIADANGTVVAVNAVNEDGEVVLSTVSLEGETIEEAGADFVDSANELGYFTPDGQKDTVYIDVECANDGEYVRIKEKLNNRICEYFDNKGINGKVCAETLEKYADKATEWGLSKGQAKLVMRVLDTCPELTDTEVLAMDMQGRMKLLCGNGNKGGGGIAVGLKPEYRASVDALKDEYARAFELCEEIKKLEAQLEGDLSDEETAAIEAQIAEKEAERKPLHDEYKEKVGELKESFREASKEERKGYRTEAENRKNQNKGKQQGKAGACTTAVAE